jgi:heme exporter protein CcmD
MPDLGEYAPYVLSAWGVVVVALSLLTAYIVIDGRRLRRRLAELERRTRSERTGGGGQ